MTRTDYQSQFRHPLLRRGPWLQLLPFLLPFSFLFYLTISNLSPVPPARHLMPGNVRDSTLVAIGADGTAYLQHMLARPHYLYAVDNRGRKLWVIDPLDVGDLAGSPLIMRMQEQSNGVTVFQTFYRQIVAINMDGSVAWGFDPGFELSERNFSSSLPAEEMPSFTCWHDGKRNLFALDMLGNLLWSVRTWQDQQGHYYGSSDDWEDGSILTSVRVSGNTHLGGRGEFLLRRLEANGRLEELFEVELSGHQIPPIGISEDVIIMQEGQINPLGVYRNGELLSGADVLDADSWCLLEEGFAAIDSSNHLQFHRFDSQLKFTAAGQWVRGEILSDDRGLVYAVARVNLEPCLLDKLPAWQPAMQKLRRHMHSGLGIDRLELRCMTSGGNEEWSRIIANPRFRPHRTRRQPGSGGPLWRSTQREPGEVELAINRNWLVVKTEEELLQFRLGD